MAQSTQVPGSVVSIGLDENAPGVVAHHIENPGNGIVVVRAFGGIGVRAEDGGAVAAIGIDRIQVTGIQGLIKQAVITVQFDQKSFLVDPGELSGPDLAAEAGTRGHFLVLEPDDDDAALPVLVVHSGCQILAVRRNLDFIELGMPSEALYIDILSCLNGGCPEQKKKQETDQGPVNETMNEHGELPFCC